jgi:hypothetical protein
VVTLGSDAHRALIEQVVAHYRLDGRVRAVAVFGSVSTGTWHELSDVDLDIVTGDGVDVAPGREARALFGSGARRGRLRVTGQVTAVPAQPGTRHAGWRNLFRVACGPLRLPGLTIGTARSLSFTR